MVKRLKSFVCYNIYEEPMKRLIKADSLDEAIRKAPKSALRCEPLGRRSPAVVRKISAKAKALKGRLMAPREFDKFLSELYPTGKRRK